MKPEIEKQFLNAYDTMADAIYRHCLFRVYDSHKAEDLVQECFMKTWTYLSGGKKVDNLKAFLYKVANNLIIDASRKHKEESLENVLEANPAREPSYDGREAVETKLMHADVLKAISDLPDDYRIVMLLRYVDGLEPREIADVVGVSANNVSVRINRGTALLKEQMEFN